MVYLKVAIFWLCFYVEKEACVPINQVVSLWCDFLWRK
jgi:hypothetical protein